MIRCAFAMSGAIFLAAWSGAAVPTEIYPAKPVRLIVPAPPGSVTDVRGRWLAEKLPPSLGQPIVVENRAGAAG